MVIYELTCWNSHLLVFCVLEEIWCKMKLWGWIMYKFVFISCCWSLLNCWNQIGETGIVVYGFEEKIVVVLLWRKFLVQWVGLLFLMLDSCLFKCIEAILTHKQFLEHVLGLGVIKIGIFGWKWVEHEDLNFFPEVLFRNSGSEALFRCSGLEALFRSSGSEALFQMLRIRSTVQKLQIRSTVQMLRIRSTVQMLRIRSTVQKRVCSEAYSSWTASPVLRPCVFFSHFCFELAFGVNMKILDNWISFAMALDWRENVLWILSYD